MGILLTAFEPFGDEKVNPSAQAVEMVSGVIGSVEVRKLLLPVSYVRAEQLLMDELEKDPDIVLCTGQAGGRAAPSFEKIAVNFDEAAIADNDGEKREGVHIRDGGRAAYFSTLPLKDLVSYLNNRGLPAYISWDAGRFICNHVFYRLMEWIEDEKPAARGGFLHLPFSTRQACGRNVPSMNLTDMAAVIETTLDALQHD